MKSHEFYQQYANLPLKKRFQIINFAKYGTLNLHKIYIQIKKIDDKIRPTIIERRKLIDIAEEYLK